MSPYLAVVLSILLIGASQLLFKSEIMATMPLLGADTSITKRVFSIIFRKFILLGLFLNGIAAICWLLALTKLELSYVFPFISLNYILVPLGAVILFKEKLSKKKIVGIGIICIGIFIIALS